MHPLFWQSLLKKRKISPQKVLRKNCEKKVTPEVRAAEAKVRAAEEILYHLETLRQLRKTLSMKAQGMVKG
jgi:hypothetical protein